MNRLIGELLGRHVLHIAAGYLIVGWLIMQVVSVMTPALNLPDRVGAWVAVLPFVNLSQGVEQAPGKDDLQCEALPIR
ncbi:hypothetical protein [Maricaulis sp.]|uniref:hypothetical protein n=1 Tax=Maricaulis sp. TaxID=1486257 RepID=UPI003A8CA675